MTDLTVLVIDTPTLGDRSYLVHDGEVAFVVDPQRDVAQYLLDNGDRPEYMAVIDAHLTRWLGGREEFLRV